MSKDTKRLRSQEWFDDPHDPGMTALYLERYLNYGLTPEELRSGRPIIGIAQTGSDLSPCNRVHLELAKRLADGIRDKGGIPIEFPTHPIQETGKRPTAALDRNLAYLSLVEILHGYPLDAVVLTTGCDKTTPSLLMAAATVDIPAIVLSAGPMLDGHWRGMLAGSGSIIWEARQLYSKKKISGEEFIDMACEGATSTGHCNTMGTALSMNSLAEALGMSLPGNAAIPAAYRSRRRMAYHTGTRIVEMVWENLTPSQILTREAFLNAIAVNTAIGGSTNCPVHLIAIARHAGVELTVDDFDTHGYPLPLLANCQPLGKYLGEAFYRAGGVPAVMHELYRAGKLYGKCLTVNGKTIGDNVASCPSQDSEVIRPFSDPLMDNAGFMVMKGNMFRSGILKTAAISEEFRARYLNNPEDPMAWEGRAIMFEGPEDYHQRINDPSLNIDDTCILMIRNCGPVGFPGSAEVVNMQPPDMLLKSGVSVLPCIGDGRQSGTSGCPSILNCSPESAVGGGLAIIRTGDRIRIDLTKRTANLLLSDEEIAKRYEELNQVAPKSQTPWQELYRANVTQLDEGACLRSAEKYRQIKNKMPRHSH